MKYYCIRFYNKYSAQPVAVYYREFETETERNLWAAWVKKECGYFRCEFERISSYTFLLQTQ